jgi:hypothetical protein
MREYLNMSFLSLELI